MSYDIRPEEVEKCPKCGEKNLIKVDVRGAFYCGKCGWDRDIKPVQKVFRSFRAKRSALIQDARYSLCGCGSGKKAKFCCWDKLVQEARGK